MSLFLTLWVVALIGAAFGYFAKAVFGRGDSRPSPYEQVDALFDRARDQMGAGRGGWSSW